MATRRKAGRKSRSQTRHRRRLAWLAALLALFFAAIPLALTPIYKYAAPVSTLMIYQRLVDGPVAHQWMSLDEIAPSLIASVVMSEDGQFCNHRGVDWQELDKALDDLDERPRGASTIAMQTVKNLFLWTSRSVFRKAIEIPLALYADAVLGKRRLMEIYLNIAEFSPGIFGAEAAAQHFFGRDASNLTRAQSARLTAVLPSPETRDPGNPSRGVAARSRTIAAQARIAGAYIVCLDL